MTKAELIQRVCEKTGMAKMEVDIVVDAVLSAFKESFVNKERIEIRGFGIFQPKKRKPRIGRNPRTKEEVKIPERTVIVFKPSKLLKDKIG